MIINKLKNILKDDLVKLNKCIYINLISEIKLINNVSFYIINNPGKRIRPLLVILTAKIFKTTNNSHIQMASVLEYIHTATLLHDDVIDKAVLRRDKEATHIRWNNRTAILVGDFLYSRAFQIMMLYENNKILNIIAKTTNKIAEGEVLQLHNQYNYNITEKTYYHIIKLKTAKLFEASTNIGAVLNKNKKEDIKNITRCGYHIGVAYQILDDLYDYKQNKTGKKCYNDLKEGKITLPLIYCLKNIKKINRIKLIKILKTPLRILNKENDILHHLNQVNTISYCEKKVQKEITNALGVLNKVRINNIYTNILKLFIQSINN